MYPYTHIDMHIHTSAIIIRYSDTGMPLIMSYPSIYKCIHIYKGKKRKLLPQRYMFFLGPAFRSQTRHVQLISE